MTNGKACTTQSYVLNAWSLIRDCYISECILSSNILSPLLEMNIFLRANFLNFRSSRMLSPTHLYSMTPAPPPKENIQPSVNQRSPTLKRSIWAWKLSNRQTMISRHGGHVCGCPKKTPQKGKREKGKRRGLYNFSLY